MSRNSESEEVKSGNAGNKKRKSRSGKGKALRVFLIVVCVILLLLAGMAGAFLAMQAQGRKQLRKAEGEVAIIAPQTVKEVEVVEEGKKVVYKGEEYCYNENVINILCMGIDKTADRMDSSRYGGNGQADLVILVSVDTVTGQVSLLNISREAMVDVSKYNVEGHYMGTENMQLCLAYSYGDGKEKSCENTAEAVSRFLYGIPIHAYVSMNFEGISVLNDAVGGVTVEILEEVPGFDSKMKKGAVLTLNGKQAHAYVRSRDTEVLESNNMRMARQKQYLMAFIQKALEKTREDLSVPLTMYHSVSDYMVTDIGTSKITYLASLVLKNGIQASDLYSVPGQVTAGEKYAEFIPDEGALYEMVLQIFYVKEN